MTQPPTKCFTGVSPILQHLDKIFEDELRKAATALALHDVDADDAAQWLADQRTAWEQQRIRIQRALRAWIRDPQADILRIAAS